VSEQSVTPPREPYGVPACAKARDRVDEVLMGWARERPDLDFTPVGVVSRLARVRTRIDAELSAVFARFGLTHADFAVIVTLRRAGEPYAMPQARLMDALELTSGTVSVRLDRLERNGIVSRETGHVNARSSLVRLTATGQRLFDQVAPVHLANEERLLSALTPADRQHLADLLRRLLADFAAHPPQPAEHLGLIIEPAHIARTRRIAVGLSDTAGLLVADVATDSPAAHAGLERGDLLTAANDTPLRSSIELALLLEQLAGQPAVTLHYLRGNEAGTTRLALPRPGRT
jgi:DNA-binding MarR family transcriptional regulator